MSDGNPSSSNLPFSARSMLQVCWALTLVLSHEPQQQQLGKTFQDYFMKIIAGYDGLDEKAGKDDGGHDQAPSLGHDVESKPDSSANDGEPPASDPKAALVQSADVRSSPTAPLPPPPSSRPQSSERAHGTDVSKVEQGFVHELLMAVAKNVRDIAFVRENHVRYLDFMAADLGQYVKFWDDIADFTSTSASSITTKLVSFVTGGAALSTLHPQFSPLEVLLFTVGGLVASFGVTLVMKLVRKTRLDGEYKKVELMQESYWRKHFKMDMASQLLVFYREYNDLVHRFFSDAELQSKRRDDLLDAPNEDKAWGVIWDEILPTDRITWPPYIGSQAPTSPPSKGAPAPPGKSGGETSS